MTAENDPAVEKCEALRYETFNGRESRELRRLGLR
jgi:hypothetical protein